MSRRNIGLILLLVASVILGVVIGVVFFGLFQHTVPPAVLSSFNRASAQVAFVTYGIVAGVVIAFWSLGVIAVSRLFRGESPPRD
jgi:hypothetical protein